MQNVKDKTCRVCKEKFKPFQSLQAVCSPKCAVDLAQRKREKKERIEKKKAREDLMTKSDHAALAQKACNRYIRARDKGQVCISCLKPPKKVQAGHYRSVGSQPSLRYSEWNINLQCMACNSHLSGNIVEYRINLVNKLGADMVEWLETDHPAKNYTIDELKEIRTLYNEFALELEKGNGRR